MASPLVAREAFLEATVCWKLIEKHVSGLVVSELAPAPLTLKVLA